MDDNTRLTYHPFEENTVPLVSEYYHENSKLGPCDIGTYSRISYFNNSQVGHDLVMRSAKRYACANRIPMPKPLALNDTLGNVISNRISSSSFSGNQVSLEQLATLLKYGNGITRFAAEKGVYHRAIPSGGALYPTELYALPLDMSELDQGAYHYEVFEHQLAKFHDNPAEPYIGTACKTNLALPTASVALIISASFHRQQIKYQERAYRFSLMEAGHLAQNILLACSSLGLGALPIGGFMDDVMNDYLQIDGRDEAVLYIILVGGHTFKQ